MSILVLAVAKWVSHIILLEMIKLTNVMVLWCTIHTLERLDNCYINEFGTSFASAHITGVIGKMIYNMGKYNHKMILDELRSNALIVKEIPKYSHYSHKKNMISKAIVFPYCNEQFAFIQHLIHLDFQLIGVCNTIQSNQISNINSFKHQNFKTVDIFNIDFSTFDTIILCQKNLAIFKTYETNIFEVLKLCVDYNKKIIAFDYSIYDYYISIGGKEKLFNAPRIVAENVPNYNVGKLYLSNTAVIGVFCINKCYSQDSILIELNQKFLSESYKVDLLVANPELQFFTNNIIPLGFKNLKTFKSTELISIINNLIQQLEINELDLIFVGNEYGYLPNELCNISEAKTLQYEFLIGTNPDKTILCISNKDSNEKIRRNINYIQSLTNTEVIAIIITDKCNAEMKVNNIDEAMNINVLSDIEIEFDIPCFKSADPAVINYLYQVIIKSYSDVE